MSIHHIHFSQDADDGNGHRIQLRPEDEVKHFRVSTADDDRERDAVSANPAARIDEWVDLVFADDGAPTGWQARIPLDIGIGHALVRRDPGREGEDGAPGYWVEVHPSGWPHRRIPTSEPVTPGYRSQWIPWGGPGPVPEWRPLADRPV